MADHPREDTPAFLWALGLYAISSLVGLSVALSDEGKNHDTVVGSLVLVPIVCVGLAGFARRGHRWPWWVLLSLLVIGLISVLVAMLVDGPAWSDLVLPLYAAALVALMHGRPTRTSLSSNA